MVLYSKNGKLMFNDRLLSCLLEKRHNDVVAILKNVDVKNLVDSDGMTLLHHVTNADCDTTSKYLIKQKQCKVDVLDNDGNTPLINAIRRKNTLTIEFLLKSNADILLCGQGKETPLKMVLAPEYVAKESTAYKKFFNILSRRFVEDSQQIGRILIDANCPFPRAMYFKDILITEYMLNMGSDINEHDPYDECTALHNAINYTDPLNAKLLLERGADTYAKDKSGRIPLNYYSIGEANSKDVLIALLNHDTSLGASSDKDYEFASRVLQRGRSEEVEVILKHGFDLEAEFGCCGGSTLLHSIAENKNPGVIEQLEGMKFDVEKTDSLGNTALFYASVSSNPSGLEFLLKNGFDPDETNNEGYTAFCYGFEDWTSEDSPSKRTDNLKCVEIFIEYNADIFCTNDDGNTFFDLNLNMEHYPLIKFLISQVAMMEATGQRITENIFKALASAVLYKNFFALCRREIEKLRKTMINETVCLFQFLTESDNKLLGYVRDGKSAEKLGKIISELHKTDILFIKRLRKRAQNILETAKLREQASSIISKLSGCGNQDVIERIILFLDKQSLKKLCEADAVLINTVE